MGGGGGEGSPAPTLPATEEQSEQVERQEAHVQELAPPVDSSKLEVLDQPRHTPLPSAPVRARPRSPAPVERRSPSDCQRLPVPHYIKEAAAAAQEAGTRRAARIPPRHTQSRVTEERLRRQVLPLL